ncbi:DUF1284 domain-containing protein [Sulfoacidibacillus thermotolerans]|uniref:DUF1284 domain-containing protein n=1 Tax=Sulfoacidibacillus thermotolerans TaxID=1765684 RepID=A0A2U3DAK1_SULT2|nr:DUF1284 domain-containing protein [Sulfoacidibacillus thermotolerans]PWI58301.1 hypothetical protein BM613_03500 [Sulfoacidibacillus thermotolerans]
MFRLRGHHLLCLLGYRGMGYSPAYVATMTNLHQTLRTAPETKILLVLGPDDLCKNFPDSQTYHCEDANIHARDAAVLEKLGLQIGQVLPWQEIQHRIAQNIVPHDIPTLCSTCPWRSYGYCEQGVEEIKAGKGLRIID